jgi:hypothetical protein
MDKMASYQTLSAQSPTAFDLTIHVIPKVSIDDLDEGDLDDNGICLVDGRYRLSLDMGTEKSATFHDRALELFHAINGVYEPDNYRFLVSTFSRNMDGFIRRHLGNWSVVSNSPENWTAIDQDPEHARFDLAYS